MPQLSLHAPIFDLTITEEAGSIVALDWGWSSDQDRTPLLIEAKAQLDAYFDGDVLNFDLPFNPQVSKFQRDILDATTRIPYGMTRTYAELGSDVKAIPRAVGQVCGRNPIPILIPCHRVLSEKGMGGYSGDGGIETKQILLSLEGVLLPL